MFIGGGGIPPLAPGHVRANSWAGQVRGRGNARTGGMHGQTPKSSMLREESCASDKSHATTWTHTRLCLCVSVSVCLCVRVSVWRKQAALTSPKGSAAKYMCLSMPSTLPFTSPLLPPAKPTHFHRPSAVICREGLDAQGTLAPGGCNRFVGALGAQTVTCSCPPRATFRIEDPNTMDFSQLSLRGAPGARPRGWRERGLG